MAKSMEAVDTEKAHEKAHAWKLLSWDEIPKWQQFVFSTPTYFTKAYNHRDNEYILWGYRPVSGSFKGSLGSLVHVHNETVNIFSHLFGALLFFTLPFIVYHEIYLRYPSASPADIAVFSTFFFGVAICFLLSSTYAHNYFPITPIRVP
jgi:adiponectin receptor